MNGASASTSLASIAGREHRWGLLHEGMTNFVTLTAALGLGGSVLRVGFEDGSYLTDATAAASNAQLVEW